MGQRDSFSLYDVQKINTLYKCDSPGGSRPGRPGAISIPPTRVPPIAGNAGQIAPTRIPPVAGNKFPGGYPSGPYPGPYGPSGPYPGGPSGPYISGPGPYPPSGISGPGYGPGPYYPTGPYGPSGFFPYDTKQEVTKEKEQVA